MLFSHKSVKGTKKIVSISDLHVPFTNIEYLEEVFTKHRGADKLIINGDLFDCYSISSYGKANIIHLVDEYVLATKIVDKACKLFDEVEIIEGNHDEREDRYKKEINPELKFLLSKPLLQRVADGDRYNPATKKWTTVTNSNLSFCQSWFSMTGKAMFAHPSKYRKHEATVSFDTYEYFQKKGYVMDCVVVGHVHRLNVAYTNRALLIEQGCLCDDMDYANSPRMSYSGQVNGYAVIYQDENGNTDYKRSGIEFLGP